MVSARPGSSSRIFSSQEIEKPKSPSTRKTNLIYPYNSLSLLRRENILHLIYMDLKNTIPFEISQSKYPIGPGGVA